MLEVKKIIFQIENNIEAILSQSTALGVDLWHILLQQHPADIATLIERIPHELQIELLKKLPRELSIATFKHLDSDLQSNLLIHLDLDHATSILNKMPVDDLTDLFDHLSDEDLEKYLKLLQKRERNRIISLLNFNPRSAGGRMNSDVLTLQKDFTVRKSIDLLQRIGNKKDLMERIYVTNKDHVLVGHITLDKLVLNRPETQLSSIIQKNELHVYVDEDQEDVADQMHHYELSSVPVVDKQSHFLGVITAQDVVDIIKEEETEDVYKMSGLSSVGQSYFTTPLLRFVWHRSTWLVSLMLFQSVSSMIMGSYNAMIQSHAVFSLFLTMLIGTGGNAGNQSATLVIRGLINGEISRDNAARVLLRELSVGLIIALLLAITGFIRVFYFANTTLIGALAINASLFLIVITSIIMGAIIPILLDRFNVDPAHSAAPFLATLMDILGVLIYCIVCSRILG